MKTKISALALFLCLTTACLHKAGNAPITPWERVMSDNAVFAQLNSSVEQGTEAVVTSGLLKPADAAPVIGFSGEVANIHRQLTAILANGPNINATNLATISTLLAQVQTSGTALVQSGSIGVKNPNTQQTIAADIQSLVSLAQSLLAEIQAARTVSTAGIYEYDRLEVFDTAGLQMLGGAN